ncbi:MAG: hypothetical protein KDD47_14875, partial [Acidobacteria bacterium]|nr:hypothetical protein [Acidobacteriota bacterium]
DEQGEMLFRQVDFEIPGREGRLRGWWHEHLEALRSMDKIYIFSQNDHGEVILGTMEPEGLYATTLKESRLLSREVVAITRCTPIAQDPVPGSSRQSGDLLFPDLPIRGDFLDLVETPDGEPLLEALKNAVPPGDGWRLPVRTDGGGNLRVEWNLPLRGRRDPLRVATLPIPADEPPDQAHWMVWPNFRDRAGKWKAYYIFEWAENHQLDLETLWLKEGGKGGLQRLVPSRKVLGDRELVAYPVAFRPGEDRVHDGGPPVAFSLRHRDNDEEMGLYLIRLRTLGSSPSNVDMAVDFGTSHSAAAVSVGDRGSAVPIRFLPELEAGEAVPRLTHHVSENNAHVQADEGSLGVLANSSWLPTYTNYSAEASRGFLPSELLLYREIQKAQADTVSHWRPATHYLIPAMTIGRERLGDYVVADFKWDTGASHFRGREQELRESYLEMFLELALAELVSVHLQSFPEAQVNLTFTYPLRSREDQVEAFQASLRRTVRRCSASLGIVLGLQRDIGIFDESRAAQISKEAFGEVVLVGDLGGGTLDLFVSGTGSGAVELPQVADSVRLGGNLLIRQIADEPQGLLPNDGGWDLGNPSSTEAKLRAWMRSHGSARLFGTEASGRIRLGGIGVTGFGSAADGERGRALLSRYFRLVVEYLARNLAAYLFVHWFPAVKEEDYERLRLSVQLRGNGWGLRYQGDSAAQANRAIQQQVRARVLELWEGIADNSYPNPAKEAKWAQITDEDARDPKIKPVRQAVGEAMPFEEVKKRWHTHTLVNLEVSRGNGERKNVPWYQKIPFVTGGSTEVEMPGISPPVLLTSPHEDRRFELSGLQSSKTGGINKALKKGEATTDRESGLYRAPVAPLVWEAIFESRAFWPGREIHDETSSS